MSWKALRYTSYAMLLVAVVFGFAWFVAWGYGVEGMATIFAAIAFIVLVSGGVVARISRLERFTPEWDRDRYVTQIRHADGTETTHRGSDAYYRTHHTDAATDRAWDRSGERARRSPLEDPAVQSRLPPDVRVRTHGPPPRGGPAGA